MRGFAPIASEMDMNHYEELGVDCDAPAEEIRRAYKTLVRLLHPDGQTDEKLKAMAERQLQRLNGVLEILTDPKRRREYDEGLLASRTAVAVPAVETPLGKWRRPGGPLPRRSQGRTSSGPGTVALSGAEWVQAAVRHWFWVLVGTTFVGTAAVWWAMSPEGGLTEVLLVREPGQAAAAAPGGLRRSGGGTAKERVIEDWSAPRDFADPLSRKQGTEAAEAGPVELEAGTDPKSEESRFAGTWLAAPVAEKTSGPGTYPMVYAELLLSEDKEELVGSYRARYKMPDKTISPEVELRIRWRGPFGRSARTQWVSGSGAKGVLEMWLRPSGLLSVVWWTTELGPHSEMTSGRALLVKRQAP